MKKIVCVSFILALLACILTFAVSAAEINYKIETVDEGAGTYKVVATIKNPGGIFATFKSDVTFDNSIIVPVSAKTGSDANIAGGTVKTPIKITTYYDPDIEEDTEITHSPISPSWSVSGTKATLIIETYTTLKTIDTTEVMAFEMYFRFADGKTAADLKADSFIIDYIKYADHNTGIETYNAEDESTNTLILSNDVVPEAPAKLTIPVTAGDVIYLQDGTSAVAETTGDYEILADDGYVTVNTGYDSQKVYLVESGVVSEQTDLRDGVLGTDASAIRNDQVASGIRFKSSFLTVLKSNVKEYGYLVTVESDHNALPADYELNMALVDSGKAKKGVAYSEADGIDVSYGTDAERTIITMVATGVPLTKEAVMTNIVARPYYILENGAVIYGEPATRQVIEVALAIKNEDKAAYEENKEYIDDIISLVSEEELEVIIQLGPLF